MGISAADEAWMRRALALARQAEEQGEVPVGAILVRQGEIVATGHNQPIARHDCSAHAEIVCLRNAGQALQNYRMPGATLYVTLEPCVMCAGAIIQARIQRLVFAAEDPKAGACGSVFDVLNTHRLNHQVEWQGGVLAEESSQILRDFFRARRQSVATQGALKEERRS